MHISQQGLDLIKHYEGFSSHPYQCPAGFWTVGYGHVIHTPGDFSTAITQEEGAALLIKDIRVAEDAVTRLISFALSQNRFDALTSFTFNLGAAALQRSTLRRKINRGEHAQVPAEFMKWVWAGGRKLPGLIRRRAAESLLYSVAS